MIQGAVWTMLAFFLMFGLPLLFHHLLTPAAKLVGVVRYEIEKRRCRRAIRRITRLCVEEQRLRKLHRRFTVGGRKYGR